MPYSLNCRQGVLDDYLQPISRAGAVTPEIQIDQQPAWTLDRRRGKLINKLLHQESDVLVPHRDGPGAARQYYLQPGGRIIDRLGQQGRILEQCGETAVVRRKPPRQRAPLSGAGS